MKVSVLHEGEYTNGHVYARITTYDLEHYAKLTDTDFYQRWEELLFNDTGDGVTEPGVGSWYGAVIIESEDPALVGRKWEWAD